MSGGGASCVSGDCMRVCCRDWLGGSVGEDCLHGRADDAEIMSTVK